MCAEPGISLRHLPSDPSDGQRQIKLNPKRERADARAPLSTTAHGSHSKTRACQAERAAQVPEAVEPPASLPRYRLPR